MSTPASAWDRAWRKPSRSSSSPILSNRLLASRNSAGSRRCIKVATGTKLEVVNGKKKTYEFRGAGRFIDDALEEVAKEMEGQVKIAKIDVDSSPEVTNKYQIQAMPTLIMIKDGEVVARHTGALVQKSKLEAWIKESV